MQHRSTLDRTVIKRAVTSSTLVVAAVFMALNPALHTMADKYDDQINAIRVEVSAYQNQAAALAQQADTLQNKVNALNAQKAAIQSQVDLSQAKYDQLTQQIADNEAKLISQQHFLGDTLAQLYVDNDTSSIEMLAGSKSIGDYIDKQEYRSVIRNQALSAIKDIKDLKIQLAKQQIEVKQVLADQTAQRNDLAAKEAEQAQLLADTQGQEAAYQAQIGSKNSQISNLKAQQAAAYASYTSRNNIHLVPGDPNKGGYPGILANSPQDSLLDNWGMFNRECVSYTAWRVSNDGKYMPYWGGNGNAYEWPDNARAAGIPVDSTPTRGSIAIWGINQIGGVGHAAYVEGVSGNTIHVSQYNYGVHGSYSEMDVSASGLEFIHF